MSLSTCSLSGHPLISPVISKKTGHIFEKEHIVKHVKQTGQCPITGCDLSEDDLIDVNVAPVARPKPLAVNSIPGMIQMFQAEWDTMVMEVYEMRKALDQSRKELAHALYYNDAALRVVSR